jgi:hypothetical protein
MLVILVVFLALLTGIACAQCGNLDGVNITVPSHGVYTAENQYLAPKPGMKLYAVEVTVMNNMRQSVSYNAFYFSLQDSNGYVYTYGMGKRPALSCGDLEPGRLVRGFLTFTVPAGAGGFTLIYKPSAFSSGQLLLKL